MSADSAADVELPSEKRFGLVFGGILALIGAWLLWRKGAEWGWWLLGIGALFALLGVVAPRALRLPNRLWFGLGLLLGRIISPIVLGLMFLVLITPVALVTRIAGRDALRLRRRVVDSYWIRREPAGPPPDSFRNQY